MRAKLRKRKDRRDGVARVVTVMMIKIVNLSDGCIEITTNSERVVTGYVVLSGIVERSREEIRECDDDDDDDEESQ